MNQHRGLAKSAEQLAIQNFYAMAQIGLETVKVGLEKIAPQYDVDGLSLYLIFTVHKASENFKLTPWVKTSSNPVFK